MQDVLTEFAAGGVEEQTFHRLRTRAVILAARIRDENLTAHINAFYLAADAYRLDALDESRTKELEAAVITVMNLSGDLLDAALRPS